jgi:hypothetical protein
MGVWQRSPHGLRIALTDPGLDAANRAALPDLRPEDVIGSPLLHVSVRERGDAIEQLEELVAITRGQEVKPQCELRFLTSG